MKKFLSKTFLYLSFPLFIFIAGLFLPATPKAKQSLLMSKFTKDSLFDNVQKPRIIFIGGSSMSLGLNSQVIKDSLGLNPINTGIHAGLGLFYMMEDAVTHIKKDDIIIVAPEYHQFYGNFAYGGEELLRAVFDTSTFDVLLKLKFGQFKKMFGYIPKYAMSKFMPNQYFNLDKTDFYSKEAFNKYGDAVEHWDRVYSIPVEPFKQIEGGDFNNELIVAIDNFNKQVVEKGATVYFSFPPFEETSFANCKNQILHIENQMKSKNITIISKPENFTMNYEEIFDTPYHLNKKGVEKRTQLLIKDIEIALSKK
jgi:hypothetical protein